METCIFTEICKIQVFNNVKLFNIYRIVFINVKQDNLNNVTNVK